MESLFFELTEILTRQVKIVKEQLTAAEDQNRALRLADTDSLALAVQRIDELTAQIIEMDRQREQVQRQLESALNLPQGATVSELMPKAPLEVIFKLKNITRELKKDLRQMDELNSINNLLTRRAMQINETLLELLKSGGVKQTYQNSGALKQSNRPTTVLNKTI